MEAHTLERELESTLESVDSAEQIVVAEAQALGLDEDDLYRVGIAIRECMVNAVVHGNRYNSRKKVHLKVERTADRREDSLLLTSTLKTEAQLAVVSARSACSR